MPGTVFDGHHHLGAIPGWEPTGARAAIADEAAARAATMDRHGIAQACVMPSSSYDRPLGTADLRAVNDTIAALRDADPGRFPVALDTTDLWLGTDTFAEAERALDELALDGLAWHHRLQGVYIDDARMDPILELLAARGKVAAIHVFADSTFESPWRLENLAERHRDVSFVALDAFSGYDQACWMSRIARHHPNVWFDTAAMTTNANILGRFVADAGSDRLLLGTNHYGAGQTDYSPTALHIVQASTVLTDADKTAVLGANARALYGVTAPPS